MTAKSLSAAYELAPSTDTYLDGLNKVYNGLDDIYTEINALFGASYSTTAPTNPETGWLWLDSNTTPPVLKYWTGAAWSSVSATASFGSGLGFDVAFSGFSDRVILTKASAAVIQVAASAALPATLFIEDVGVAMLQNTSTVQKTISGTAGTYDIWAQRNGAGTDFTLAFVASGGTPAGENSAYGQRKIGEVYWDTAAIRAIRSLEFDDSFKYATPNQLFYAYLDTGTTFALNNNTPTTVETAETYYDLDGVEANGVFTAARAGWYEFGAGMRLSKAAVTSFELKLQLFKDAAATAFASAYAKDTAATSSTLTIKAQLNSGPIYLTAAQTVTFKATQTNDHASSKNITDATSAIANVNERHDFGWWGRYIGY